MKKVLSLLFVLLLITLIACTAPAAAPAATPTPEPTAAAPTTVVFADPVLETMVRDAMGKPTGDITIAEAEAVKELRLGIEWQPQIPPETQMKDLSGIEAFQNLELLDLSFHHISDISPLTGLTKLTTLSLGGNPVQDITPISGMTSLRELKLFNCEANDYSALTKLTTLEFLMLDRSPFEDASLLSGLTQLNWLSISYTQVKDVSPLAGLTNLRHLSLSECPITDYTPLRAIYPNLEEPDFNLASSLRELGFMPIDNAPQVESYKTDEFFVQVHHEDWGKQGNPDEVNAVIFVNHHGTDREIGVIYHPESATYLVYHNGEQGGFRYTLNATDKAIHIEYGEEAANTFLQELYPSPTVDLLLAPVEEFEATLKTTFSSTASVLYALPRETKTIDASSLMSLGFLASPEIASYLYEQKEEPQFSIAVHNPAWGVWDEGGDVSYFKVISDEYRVVIRYFIQERKFLVKGDDNFGGGASFEYFVDRNEFVDGWHSEPNGTVLEYFQKSYNDPSIQDIHTYSIELMETCIQSAFGLTIEELFALPVGD